jgi:cation transporter-like permease
MDSKLRGAFVPVVLSILALIVWLSFILAYALLWSGRFSLFQDFIVAIVSFLVTGLLVSLMWVIWAFKVAKWGNLSLPFPEATF